MKQRKLFLKRFVHPKGKRKLSKWLYIRQGRYSQIAKLRFHSCMKWHKNSNTVFYVHLRNLVRNWGPFSSTTLVLNLVVKYCSVLEYLPQFQTKFLRWMQKLYYYILFLLDQKCVLTILEEEKRLKSSLLTANYYCLMINSLSTAIRGLLTI